MKLLQPFKKLTVLGEGRGTVYRSIGSVLWEFDNLLNLLEMARAKSRPSEAPFQSALDTAWTKLDKYYGETDKYPVYIITTMLDPRMKYEYFERQWREDWLDDAKCKMQAAFNQYWSEMELPSTTSSPVHTDSDDDEDEFDIYRWRFGDMKHREDELTRYLKALRLELMTVDENDAFDVLELWKGNSKEWPTLARIAFDIYSIPAMSVEPERAFSG